MPTGYIDLKYKPNKNDVITFYYVEPNKISLSSAAEKIASESSIGTWTALTTLDEKTKQRLKARVFDINKKDKLIKVAYPIELFELGNMPQLLSSIAGNIFGMKAIKNLRLLDIYFPKRYDKSFLGPQFGIQGIRKIFHIKKRPLVGTIIKPKLGLNARQHARVAYQAWIGGCDIVKDDENLTSMTFNKFNNRIIETLARRDKAQDETGEIKGYMPNITSDTTTMLERADFVKSQGGRYVMIDMLTAGFSALQTLRKATKRMKLIIHAHRAGHAAITRNKKHGITMLVIAKIARLIGVDQLHIGTIVGKMEGSKQEVQNIGEEIEKSFISKNKNGHVLEEKWTGIKPVFAVSSGGLHPKLVPEVIKDLGNNVILQAGGGIHGHPLGTVAGAKAMRQAVDASMKNISLKKYSKKHMELRKALEYFK